MPPVGENRFRPTKPYNLTWTDGAYMATRPGPCCLQLGSGLDLSAGQSEDCLYLNVYTPLDIPQGTLLPVLFWIHGGGGSSGCSIQETPNLYNGTNMLSPTGSVVVVTINYRLGIFGSFAHPLLKQESGITSGYDMMDQQEAMRWVKANIAAFGGDPERVTIFGESAGGNYALMHLVIDSSADLFHRAILESNTAVVPSSLRNHSLNLLAGVEFADNIGCVEGQVPDVLSCLRTVSGDMMAYYGSMWRGSQSADPTGWVLTDYPARLIREGKMQNKPVIIGTNTFEFATDLLSNSWAQEPLPRSQWMQRETQNLIMSAYEMNPVPAMRISEFGYLTDDDVDRIFKSYQRNDVLCNATLGDSVVDDCRSMAVQLISDWALTCPARWVARELVSHGLQNVYVYRFDVQMTCPIGYTGFGAAHTFELPYVFNTQSGYLIDYKRNPQRPLTCKWSDAERQIASHLNHYWTCFAATGDPNCDGSADTSKPPQWPAYTRDNDMNLLIGPKGTRAGAGILSASSYTADYTLAEQCDVYDSAMQYGVRLSPPNY